MKKIDNNFTINNGQIKTYTNTTTNTTQQMDILISYCESGNLNGLIMQIENNNVQLNYQDCEKLFNASCINGHVTIVRWLFENYEICTYANNNYAFRMACNNNHVNVAKWFLFIEPSTDDVAERLEIACVNGHLELAKVLYYDDEVIEYDRIFGRICEVGHLHIAKWILQANPNINISANNNYAYKSALANGHIDIVQWLLSLKPNINVEL